MENREGKNEQKEEIPVIIGKISIMRHGKTEYTNQYPDITEDGFAKIIENGKYLKEKVDKDKEDVLFVSSPAVRARGTLDILKGAMNEEASEPRVLKSMRSTEIRDHKEAMKMVDSVIGPEKDIPKFDRYYATNDALENSPDIWQPRSEVEGRFFTALEYAIRSFMKYNENNYSETVPKIPHLIAVSHFEFLNHFVAEVFGLDLEKNDLLKFAEMIELTIFEKAEGDDVIPIAVDFRGQKKNIVFNRNTRTITIM
jgi:broad specificity phosphatase PhoE